jgi:hypothetical protein
MMSNPNQVIVTPDDRPLHSVHGVSVHHRDFPELRGEGGSQAEAAARLAERLSCALDNVTNGWHKEMLERAIEDARAFALRDCAGPASARSRAARRGKVARG